MPSWAAPSAEWLQNPTVCSAPTFLSGLPVTRDAYAFAREARRDQCRESDAAQFIIHPLEVASLLHNTGHRDALVAAGILHDTIEDSPVTHHTTKARFGIEIAEIVDAMSEDSTIEDFEQRKMLEQMTPEHPLGRQLRFELERLHALPPRPALISEAEPADA